MISHEHVGIPGLGFQDVPSQAHRSHGRAAAAPAEPWLASCQVSDGREATDTTWGERPSELGRCHVTFETQNAWPLGWVGENEIWKSGCSWCSWKLSSLELLTTLVGFFLPSAQVAQNTSKVRPAPSPIAVSKMGSLQDAANTQPLWTTRMERNLFGQFPPVMWLAFTERSRSGIISMFPYVSRFLFSEDLGRFENPVGSDFSLVLRCFKPPNPTTMGVSENGYWHDLTWLAGRKFNEKPIRLYVLQCSS